MMLDHDYATLEAADLTVGLPAIERWLRGLTGRYGGLGARTQFAIAFGRALCGDAETGPLCAALLADHGRELEDADPTMALLALAFAPPTAWPAAVHDWVDRLRGRLDALTAAQRSHPRALVLRAAADRFDGRATIAPADLAGWPQPSLRALFAAEPAELSNLCDWIAAATAFGGARGDVVSAEVARALGAIAIAECRSYNLVLAATLVRACAYLGSPPQDDAATLRFLLLQRTSAGPFGFVNPLGDGAAQGERWTDLDFRLPTTLAVLWAVAGRVRAEAAP